MTLSLDSSSETPFTDLPQSAMAPRVLYVDADTDLPALLDRVEEEDSPAILVLQDNARPLRGTVSARLLQRRAAAAGIPLVVVTADRATTTQLKAVGIRSAATVGEARGLLSAAHSSPALGLLPPWDLPDEVPEPLITPPHDEYDASTPTPTPTPRTHIVTQGEALAEREDRTQQEEDEVRALTAVRVARGAGATPHRRARRIAWAALALLCLGIAAVGIWAFVFPQATIVISYRMGTFDRTYRTIAGAGGPVPIYTTHLQLSDALTVPATGTAQVPDGRAGGEVTLANPLDGRVDVPAGTLLATANGITFRTVAAASVPGATHAFAGSTNGQQSVQVLAVEAGPQGNVAAGAIVRLEGRLAGALLVTNYNPISGGTMRTTYHITALDIARAAGSLRAGLETRVRNELLQHYAQSPGRAISNVLVSAPHSKPLLRDGRLYAQVALSVKMTMHYLHRQDLLRFRDAHRTLSLAGQNLSPVAGTERSTLQLQRLGKQWMISDHVHAQVVPLIDITNLKGLLVGHTVGEARTLLDGSARYGHWSYTLTTNPDWAGRLPQVPGLIHIVLQHPA